MPTPYELGVGGGWRIVPSVLDGENVCRLGQGYATVLFMTEPLFVLNQTCFRRTRCLRVEGWGPDNRRESGESPCLEKDQQNKSSWL